MARSNCGWTAGCSLAPVVLEASTDLAGWAPVFTNTTPTNVLFYTDPEAASHLWRFYRALQFP